MLQDKQIEAHKIIISACSPVFRDILKTHRHSSALLYLRGVRYQDMLGLLDFMYYGEVNVAQAEINTFLATAEELQIKGLTQKDKDKELEAGGKDHVVLETPETGQPENQHFTIKSEPSLCQYGESTGENKRELVEASDCYDSTGYINDEEYHDEQQGNS